jgi:hypothetical protein
MHFLEACWVYGLIVLVSIVAWYDGFGLVRIMLAGG